MKKGFTLVELLVVISIIGILVTIALVSFRSSQARSRDAERKSDLKQISSSLELFFSDYGKYPGANASGEIAACPYSAQSATVCTWGESEFSDSKTTYFKVLPKDPVSEQNYFYRIVDAGSNQKFQIFARLENTQDPSLITTSYSCGSGNCNFALTSPNTSPSE